jgi:hypothetical protein
VGVARAVLAELVGGAVDAVVGGEGRASSKRRRNIASPACCRWYGRMSGVLGQAFGRKYSRESSWESSVKYSVSSSLVTRQVKYVYDCVKPSLASGA